MQQIKTVTPAKLRIPAIWFKNFIDLNNPAKLSPFSLAQDHKLSITKPPNHPHCR